MQRPRLQSHAVAALVCAAGAALALPGGGCNYVTPAMWIAQGPGKKPAEFTLPIDKKTVVFVDDRKNTINRLQLRSALADDVGQTIRSLNLVNEVVSGRELIAYVRRNETSSKRVSIEELGRSVGADVVIYIEMTQFTLAPDGATPKPTASALVKVVDVKERTRLFPPAGAGDHDGYEVTAEMDALSLDAYRTSAARRKTEDALEKRLADQITRLFYDHEPKGFGKGVSHMEG
ncbi:MAG: hypothetical protein U0625_07970 [Phycisphaerales bacterium]